MLGLIILCSFAVAFAAPQYTYDQGGTVASGSGSGLSAASLQQLGNIQPAYYNKQIYIHSAPDDELDGESANQLINQASKRNLRVVIIKSPENKGLENAAIQLAKSASEDRTAIYVLNKQTDLGELQHKLNQIQDLSATKPEVHFVKYKTPQEAEHAQHTIQATYDQLAGPTQVSNEGTAPLRSFIGSLGTQGQTVGGAGSLGAGSLGAGSLSSLGGLALSRGGSANGYLPPLFRFRH